MKFNRKKMRDVETGRAYTVFAQRGFDTGLMYFTSMSWLSDNRHLVLCARINGKRQCSYVKMDTATGQAETIADNRSWAGGVVSADDKLYVVRERLVEVYDLVTGESRTVCELPQGCAFHEPPSITADNRTLGLYWFDGTDWVIGICELETGQVEVAATPRFSEPYPVANHAMINPRNPHLVFYAHEGKTEHIPDRMWAVDSKTGQSRNLYRHRTVGDGGELGEYIGHEMWAPQGNELYYVKYVHSPLKPTGVFAVNVRDGESRHLNGDYPYWHAAPSPDGRWVVADTFQHPSRIVCICTTTGHSELLCTVRRWNDHPGHPHPSFSPDSRRIGFTLAGANKRLQVGIMTLF
jgi:hypothetical protein